MGSIKNVEEALRAISQEAAYRAWFYLERELPGTSSAIQFLVKDNWSEDEVMSEIDKQYGGTEEKMRHKIRLVVQAFIEQRDKGE